MTRFPDTEDGVQNRAYRLAMATAKAMDDVEWQRNSGRVVGYQLTKSATSIGANLNEANAAHSRADFIYKCSTATSAPRHSRSHTRHSTGCASVQTSSSFHVPAQLGSSLKHVSSLQSCPPFSIAARRNGSARRSIETHRARLQPDLSDSLRLCDFFEKQKAKRLKS